MGGKTTEWGGGRAQRAYDLVLALGSVSAVAAQLSQEVGHAVSAASVEGVLRHRFPDWRKAVVARLALNKRDPAATLRDRVRDLESQVEKLEEQAIDDAYVKRHILDLADSDPRPPRWTLEPQRKSASGPGVPSVLAGDWHWAERVFREQVFGKNEYNLAVARRRAKRFFEGTVDLLKNHTVAPNFPGLVVNVAGDMFSGSIHEELTATNEVPVMVAVLDLLGVWEQGIEYWLNEFGRLFVVWVRGNHTRTTKKPIAKDAAHTSYDWLLGKLLERRFRNVKEVTFLVPDGPDAYYRVFGHRYFLTHADQWKGGDGIIGALGPVARGDVRTRSRNTQVDMGYDTLLGAHWHQYLPLRRLIITGAFKGYDELAWKNGYPFEVPTQALWLTHPAHGITISAPVLLEKHRNQTTAPWVSVAA